MGAGFPRCHIGRQASPLKQKDLKEELEEKIEERLRVYWKVTVTVWGIMPPSTEAWSSNFPGTTEVKSKIA